jgi:hypothetical protein
MKMKNVFKPETFPTGLDIGKEAVRMNPPKKQGKGLPIYNKSHKFGDTNVVEATRFNPKKP